MGEWTIVQHFNWIKHGKLGKKEGPTNKAVGGWKHGDNSKESEAGDSTYISLEGAFCFVSLSHANTKLDHLMNELSFCLGGVIV